MSAAQIRRLLRTTRHLRWSQVFWRAYRGLGRRLRRGRAPAIPATWRGSGHPPLRHDLPEVPVLCGSDRRNENAVDLLGRGEFGHLNLVRHLGDEHPDWLLGAVEEHRLWAIVLHYHEWAFDLARLAASGGQEAERAARLFRDYVSDWIRRCDVTKSGARDLAWNPFAIATRLGFWARSYLAARQQIFARDKDFGTGFLGSMWRQAAYLHDHIEWDLRANHLVRDAVGLAWAGRFFEGKHARRWLNEAAGIASVQVGEQVLPDGGHFERSPMYHVQVMEDVLSLALLLEDEEARAKMRSAWERMAEYLSWMRHPDGDIPLFNDATVSGSCDPARMLSLGKHIDIEVECGLPSGGRHFADTGMVVWHGEPWIVFFDVGPLGPDYQPGHGHADTLSVECSFREKRIFVDPGVYGYDKDERRRYDRSTRAHNTVCIDGEDSSEVWHIFRVGRRARPRGVEVDLAGGGLSARASHDGYKHLAGRPVHTREVCVDRDGVMTVIDRVTGSSHHTCEGGLLVGPGWEAEEEPGGWSLSQGAARLRVEVKGPEGLKLALESRPYHPEFGLELRRPRLSWHVEATLPVEVATRIASE